jgi:mono/diheme cytochrome c family protein
MQRGGVGYYHVSDFVHLDAGAVRIITVDVIEEERVAALSCDRGAVNSGVAMRPGFLVLSGWLFVALTGCAQSSVPGADQGATPSSTTASTGERIYRGTCIACHQKDGHGITHVYPSLSGSALVLGDPAILVRWVLLGERPAALPIGRYATVMLKYNTLSNNDAAAVLSYVRSHFGNSATAVDSAAVAEAVGRAPTL